MTDTLGFSPARLARLDAHLAEKYIATRRLPCTLSLVARHGEIAHSHPQGLADVERGIPCREDTIFRIYSMTKPITSVALMMLVEQGKIALDDPVAKYIPEWKNLGVFVAGTHKLGFQTKPCTRPMQVVDLFRHTAGLTYGFQLRTNVDEAYRREKIGEIEKAGTLPLPAGTLLASSSGELLRTTLAKVLTVAEDHSAAETAAIDQQPNEASLGQSILQSLGAQSSPAMLTHVSETATLRGAPTVERVEQVSALMVEMADRVLVTDPVHGQTPEVRVKLAENIMPGTEVRLTRDVGGQLYVEFNTMSPYWAQVLNEASPLLAQRLNERLPDLAVPQIIVQQQGGKPEDGRSRNHYNPWEMEQQKAEA